MKLAISPLPGAPAEIQGPFAKPLAQLGPAGSGLLLSVLNLPGQLRKQLGRLAPGCRPRGPLDVAWLDV